MLDIINLVDSAGEVLCDTSLSGGAGNRTSPRLCAIYTICASHHAVRRTNCSSSMARVETSSSQQSETSTGWPLDMIACRAAATLSGMYIQAVHFPVHVRGSEHVTRADESVRHVYHSSYNVWRDISRTDEDGRPTCDACLSKSKSSSLAWHQHDCVLFDESAIVPSASATKAGRPQPGAPWPIGQIVEMGRSTCRLRLFERFSVWATKHQLRPSEREHCVSEVCSNDKLPWW